ncbi:MAG: VOC family protein [Proteobacteria bacterium]|nr:VOC family protein [Pseudomonadota bacterium]
MSELPRVKRIAHIVLFVSDPEASAAWYCRVLGMRISARAGDGPYKGGIFLSFGELDHDIALFKAAPGSTQGREFEHIGLELDCGGDIKRLALMHEALKSQGVRVQEILDHGVSVGVYFLDPDGHMLEVFCQLMPHGDASIRELGRNEGQANPVELPAP